MAKGFKGNPLGYVLERQYGSLFPKSGKIFHERLRDAKNLYRKDLLSHYGCVNAIEFSEEGDLLVSGGDDRRVLLWNMQTAVFGKGSPVSMKTNHTSNIFCLGFDKPHSKIYSGGNDDVVIVHDVRTGQFMVELSHRSPVYGLSISPQNNFLVATACEDGKVSMFDIRENPFIDPVIIAKQSHGFHSVVFNPVHHNLIVTSNNETGITLWDTRKPKKGLVQYDESAGRVSGISACFNSDGTQVLALRRRLPPALYDTVNPNPICQFYHPLYYNSCTMKTCCFAGENDEYILSGSDDFGLYMFRVPEDDSEWGEVHMLLQGHRSIVNQVRYNKRSNLIASSGVEKMVKLWSPIPFGEWSGSLRDERNDFARTIYTRTDYHTIVGHSPSISHDYSDQSTAEDLRMMAFFDSLIQTEIQGWDSMSEGTVSSDSDSDRQGQENIRMSWESLLRCKTKADETLKKHKPNKITTLIAQKWNKLAKMAHRRTRSVQKYNSSDKQQHRKRRTIKFESKSAANHKFKKNNGLATKSALNKRNTRSTKPEPKEPNAPEVAPVTPKKYRTRSQTIREASISLDGPSTSTGITGTNTSVYRVIEDDSDDEPSGNCTPRNNNGSGKRSNSSGNHNNSSGSHNNSSGSHNNSSGSHNHSSGSLNHSSGSHNHSSGSHNHSSGNRNNSSENHNNFAVNQNSDNNLVDIIPTPLNGSRSHVYVDIAEREDVVAESAIASPEDSDCSDDSLLRNCDDASLTPAKRKRDSGADSGFGTGATSRGPNGGPACSSDEECKYEKFKRRVKKARVNIRKQIGGDSDSN